MLGLPSCPPAAPLLAGVVGRAWLPGPALADPPRGATSPYGSLEISAHHAAVQQTWAPGFRLLFGLIMAESERYVFS